MSKPTQPMVNSSHGQPKTNPTSGQCTVRTNRRVKLRPSQVMAISTEGQPKKHQSKQRPRQWSSQDQPMVSEVKVNRTMVKTNTMSTQAKVMVRPRSPNGQTKADQWSMRSRSTNQWSRPTQRRPNPRSSQDQPKPRSTKVKSHPKVNPRPPNGQ